MIGFLFLLLTVDATFSEQKANPIRKVVTMLQNMQKQVTAEGEKEEALFEKFMCYCKNGRGDLEASIADAKNKIANFDSTVAELSAKKTQTEADLKQHQQDRTDAKEAMASATELRKKEAAAFAKESADAKTNIAALAAATAAIEKGSTGFLQTNAAKLLRTVAIEKADISDSARQELLSFLSGSEEQGYVPQSGEIVGILKQMHDEMSAGLADATAAEENAIQTYDALMAAKKKEVAALSAQIEEEIKRIGELGVEIAGMSNDLEDTKEALAEDTKFLAELNAGCDKKAAEWEEIKKRAPKSLWH
jgi:chromosome segregation ATPase